MSIEKTGKLNQLLLNWKRGTVYTAGYLKASGYSGALLNKYRKSFILKSIERGAYILYNDSIEWYGALYTLQIQENIKIHTGGKTALFIKGYAHYITENIQEVFLYGESEQSLPGWFKDHKWSVDFNYYPTKLFNSNDIGIISHNINAIDIKISSPERAIMEMLYHIPEILSFDESFLIMENLISLRPDVVQELLENCNSIKVKRLFLYLANYHNHPWFSLITESKIDLGSGKREIIKNGVLDKKYLITIPQIKGNNN